MTPTNNAAFQPAKGAASLQVGNAPYPILPNDRLIIRNAAVAISYIDPALQIKSGMIMPHLNFPFVLGIDLAGEVVEVGKDVKGFSVGDRVAGIARGIEREINSSAEGAFQNYVVVHPGYISKIPAHLKYEEAVVPGLAIATGGSALFEKKYLGLQLPEDPAPAATGKTVIIWSGASSVGAASIQLAVSAGYEVFSTASPKNFDLVRSLGATQVFDYRSSTIVKDVTQSLATRTVVGALAIGQGSAELCMDILKSCSADSQKLVIVISFPMSLEDSMLKSIIGMTSWVSRYKLNGFFKGVKSGLLVPSAEVTEHIYTHYLPKALESGKFRPTPEPYIVGNGLEKIQEGINLVKEKSLSAKKAVVLLGDFQ